MQHAPSQRSATVAHLLPGRMGSVAATDGTVTVALSMAPTELLAGLPTKKP